MLRKRPSLLHKITAAAAVLFAATCSVVALAPSAHAAPGDFFVYGGGIEGHWLVSQRLPGGELVGFTTTAPQPFAPPTLQSRNLFLFVDSGAPSAAYRLRVSDRANLAVYADVIGTIGVDGFLDRMVSGIPRSACDRQLRVEVTLGGTIVGTGVVSGGVTTYSDALTDYCGPMIAMQNGKLVGDGFTPGGQVLAQTWMGTQTVTATNYPAPPLLRSPGTPVTSFLQTPSTPAQITLTPLPPGRIATSLTSPCVGAYQNDYSATDIATNVTVQETIHC